MTPQELMDLPGAGQAERWLRANGKWKPTIRDILHIAAKHEETHFAELQKTKPDLAIIAECGYGILACIQYMLNALDTLEAK